MAVAIDTAHIAQHFIPLMQRALNLSAGNVRRYQVHRVRAHVTVVFDNSTIWRTLQKEYSHDSMLPEWDVLNWQHDPDDDVHELEVLGHLQKLSLMSPSFSNQMDHANDVTTLVASAVSPSFSTMTRGRLPSSFHRHSLRSSEVFYPSYFNWTPRDGVGEVTTGFKIYSGDRDGLDKHWHDVKSISDLEIVWDSSKRGDRYEFWQVQVDVVDLFSQRAHPSKRRWPTFNPFQQVPDSPVVEATSRGNHLRQTRRFNGVRHRPDRKTWVAEMKPPKHRTKQDFGNFKSEAQAARAVDAAFHYYRKPHLLNFPDSSPNLLARRPPAAAGLDVKAKLRFVKQEAKWLATMATNSLLPSARPHSLPFQSPEPSTSCTALSSHQFYSFSDISSPLGCVGRDEGDDGVSEPQPWVHLPPFPDIAAIEVQNIEPTLGGSSVEITERAWDGAEDFEIVAAVPNAASPRACEMKSSWLDFLMRSPPAPMYSMAPSPSHCEDHDVVHSLLELQRF